MSPRMRRLVALAVALLSAGCGQPSPTSGPSSPAPAPSPTAAVSVVCHLATADCAPALQAVGEVVSLASPPAVSVQLELGPACVGAALPPCPDVNPPVPMRAVGNATVVWSAGRTQLDIHEATDGMFVAWIVSRCPAMTQGPDPGDSIDRAMSREPAATLPAEAISEAEAIELAQAHKSLDSRFAAAAAGPFADLDILPSAGAGSGIEGDRLVWAITYAAAMTVCPPNAGGCESPQSGRLVVYLDYRTGTFLRSEGVAPAP